MTKLKRVEAPQFLIENWEAWGKEYAERRAANPSHTFSWKSWQGMSVREHILPLLKEMTKSHCSFCDGFPLGAVSRETVEHFRPKSSFPHSAYEWENLFLCCDVCQSAKGEDFDELLLKPDDTEYEFCSFFICDFKNGSIKPNPKVSLDNQKKAAKTIEIYKLNKKERCSARVEEMKKYEDLRSKNYCLDDFSYRFFLASA